MGAEEYPEMRILHIDEVIRQTSLSRATIYRRVAERRFPSPIKLSTNRIGWRQDAVLAWIEARPEQGRVMEHDDGEAAGGEAK
jgi:prophage regulatory protein